MALTIAAGHNIATSNSVGFPGEYSYRSFLFASKFSLGRALNTGEEVVLWSTLGANTISSMSGYPAVTMPSDHQISIANVYGNYYYQFKFRISIAENNPNNTAGHTPGVYLHQLEMRSLPFTLSNPTGTNHIYFRFKAWERDTSEAWMTNDTTADQYAYATSNGMNYSSCYVNSTARWLATTQSQSLNWSRAHSDSSIGITLPLSNGFTYQANESLSNFNRLGPYNVGVGSYFTGFDKSAFGSSSNPTSISLDDIWLGNFDSISGWSNVPGQTTGNQRFYNSTNPNLIASDGTLNTGLRAKLFYSTTYNSATVDLGSIGSPGDLTLSDGGSGSLIPATASVNSLATLTCNAGLSIQAPATTLATAATTVISPQKILDIVVGRYFADDYTGPDYAGDDTFRITTQTTTTGQVFLGAVKNFQTAFALNTSAGVIFGQEFVIDIVSFTDISITAVEKIVDAALVGSAATLTTDSYVYTGGVANLQSVTTVYAAPKFDHYAVANLQAVTSITASGSYSGQVIDMADQVSNYTWDSVTSWDNFNNGVWAVNGLLDQTRATLTTVGGLRHYGNATISTAANLTATGTMVQWATAVLDTHAYLTSGSRIVKDAEYLNFAAVSTLTTTGLRIEEINATLFDVCQLTTTAYVKWSANSQITTQAAVATVGGVKWMTPQANLAAVTSTNIIGGVKWMTPTATLATHAEIQARGTLNKIDTYRRIKVPKDIRATAVATDYRTIVVPQNTRVFHIAEPPLINPTIERQQV
jgi:hypothetical protein